RDRRELRPHMLLPLLGLALRRGAPEHGDVREQGAPRAARLEVTKPSSSAQHVALARAHLTWAGILDDRWAETMLRPGWARVAQVLRRPPLTRLGQNPSFAYL